MNHTRIIACAALMAFIAVSSCPALAASPPGVQGAQSREAARGIDSPRASMVKVGDPAKSDAIGLFGLKKGDPVQVTKRPDGKWVAKDPASGQSVVLESKPDLGR